MTDFTITPHLNWLEPAEERGEAHHISTQLHMLAFHEDEFESAVELIDHAENLVGEMRARDGPNDQISNRARVAKWMNIAASHAVFAIYHFRATLASIRARLGQCPELAKRVDTKLLEEAFQQVDIAFPDWRELRDSVGHFSDKMFRPEQIEQSRAPEGPFIHGTMQGRMLTFTHDGRYIGLDLSRANLERLTEIRRMVAEAFRKA